MANFLLPPSLQIQSVTPHLHNPAQQNRSQWTGRSKILGLPGCDFWTASAVFRVLATEDRIREARAFFFGLRGKANTFDLPLLPTKQFPPGYLVGNGINGPITATAQASDWWRWLKTGVDGWTARAFFPLAITNDFTFEFKPNHLADMAIGVNVDTALVGSAAANTYGIRFTPTGQAIAAEGAATPFTGAYVVGDTFNMVRSAASLKAYKNGALFWTFPDTFAPYFATAEIFQQNKSVDARLYSATAGPAVALTALGTAGLYTFTVNSAASLVKGMFGSYVNNNHQRSFVLTNILGNVLTINPAPLQNVAIGTALEFGNPLLRVRLANPEYSYDDTNGTVVFAAEVEEAI